MLFRCRRSWQRYFDDQPRCQKGSKDNLCWHRFVENFFIIVPAMRSDRSRTSDTKPFRFRNFPPRNEFAILDALAQGDCNFRDIENACHAATASARTLLQFQ
jgi:hypothetical protein